MYVVPCHAVLLSDCVLYTKQGWSKHAMDMFGMSFAMEAGSRVAKDNRNGRYGFIPLATDERGTGLALFQHEFAPWIGPDMDMIRTSANQLAAYMKANRSVDVRLGFPGIPFLPRQDVLAALSETDLGRFAHRVTIVSRNRKAEALVPGLAKMAEAC